MKNNNGIWRKLSVIITIIVLITGTVFAYAKYCGQVENNANDIAELQRVEKNAEGERRMTREAVIKLQADVDYIKQGIDEIKAELREMK